MEVDGLSLQGYSNQQAVEMLRSTGRVVQLRLVRYVHGLKFEQLQQAIASSNSATPVSQPSEVTWLIISIVLCIYTDCKEKENKYLVMQDISTAVKAVSSPPQPPKRSDSLLAEDISPAAAAAPPPPIAVCEGNEETVQEMEEVAEDSYEGELDPEVEEGLLNHWIAVLGSEYEVIVAQISKFKEGGGLGISLEGTVEKVDGEEQNPHHYIR